MAVLAALGVIIGVAAGLLSTTVVDTTTELASGSNTTTSAAPTETSSATATPSEPAETKPTKKNAGLKQDFLSAPESASTYGRIDLTGNFDGVGPGVFLQVERKEAGAWSSFPVTISTNSGGTFATYVETGISGPNIFRITAPELGRSTNQVRVQVG